MECSDASMSVKKTEERHVSRHLCTERWTISLAGTTFGSRNHSLDGVCFMIMLFNWFQGFSCPELTSLLNVGPHRSFLLSVVKCVAMLVRFRACPTPAAHFKFGPHLCRTGQQSLWGISMAWVKSMKKSRRVSNGSEPESPLAGVNQELAGTMLKRELSVFFIEAPWLAKIFLSRMGLQCIVCEL